MPDVYIKENRAVDLPEVLPAFPGGPLETYLLRAAVIHSGDAGAGHYFCVHTNIDTGTWREANDVRVTILKDRSKFQATLNDAFLFFMRSHGNELHHARCLLLGIHWRLST